MGTCSLPFTDVDLVNNIAAMPEATKFVDKNCGEIVDFETAIKVACDDMYRDTRMIREKRKEEQMWMKGR